MMKKTLFGWMLGGLITFFLAAYGLYNAFKATFTPSHELLLQFLVGGIMPLTLFLLFRVIYLQFTGSQHRRYAESYEDLSRAFGQIHDLARKHELASTQGRELSTDQIVAIFERFCESTAAAFSKIITAKCHVCIKIIYPSESTDGSIDLRVSTLGRSSGDRLFREEAYDNSIFSNTAFNRAMPDHNAPRKAAFFCNYLPFLRSYQNLSAKVHYDGKLQQFETKHRLWRYIRWKLPYKSSIVVPIIYQSGPLSDSEVLGFLCVDAPSMFVFNRKYDISILRGAAEGIYNLIHQLQRKVESANGA